MVFQDFLSFLQFLKINILKYILSYMRVLFINKNMPIEEIKKYVNTLEEKEDFQTNNTEVIKNVYVNNNFEDIFDDLIYSYNEDDYDLYIIVLDKFYNDYEADDLISRCKENVNILKNENDFKFKNLIDNSLIFE